jgi:hypothetical protein
MQWISTAPISMRAFRLSIETCRLEKPLRRDVTSQRQLTLLESLRTGTLLGAHLPRRQRLPRCLWRLLGLLGLKLGPQEGDHQER